VDIIQEAIVTPKEREVVETESSEKVISDQSLELGEKSRNEGKLKKND
jgi:hypothetical protein